MSDLEYEQTVEPYWQQDAVNDRDEWDQHLRATEQQERERVEEHE